MTQQELEGLFTPFGRIITSRILTDNEAGKNYSGSKGKIYNKIPFKLICS